MKGREDIGLLGAIAERWSQAASTWDPGALASLYAKDALLFGGRREHAVGRAAIADYFESYRGIIISATIEFEDQHILAIDEACFFAQGFARFAFTLAGNIETRPRFRTSLLVLRAAEGVIRAHHFSPEPEAPPLGD